MRPFTVCNYRFSPFPAYPPPPTPTSWCGGVVCPPFVKGKPEVLSWVTQGASRSLGYPLVCAASQGEPPCLRPGVGVGMLRLVFGGAGWGSTAERVLGGFGGPWGRAFLVEGLVCPHLGVAGAESGLWPQRGLRSWTRAGVLPLWGDV